jgi:hypothetical protein
VTENLKALPDETGDPQDTRFKPGESGNPSGRPKGTRNKLSEAFISALADDFAENGVDVIKKVRADRPHDYLKIMASVLPKEMHVDGLGSFVMRMPMPCATTAEWEKQYGSRGNG